MLSYFKALPIILAAALVTFWLAGWAFAAASRSGEIARLRWAFLLVTVAAFVSPSIWIYSLILMVLLVAFMMKPGARPPRAAALWALLVLAIPNAGVTLQGFGGIGNFLEVNHVRAMTLALLVPMVAAMRFGKQCPKPLGLPTDWFVLGYFLVQVFVVLPYASLTVLLREVVVLSMDTLLPYWIFSRAFTDPAGFISAARAYVLTILVMTIIAVFEFLTRWPLYNSVTLAWGFQWDMAIYLERNGFLRAKASAGQSLIFGFVLVVALGLWLVVRREVAVKGLAWLGDLALCGGLVAALARGSWVGSLLLLTTAMLLGRNPVQRLILFGVCLGAMLALALAVPALNGLIDFLPFVGRVDSENVVYRQRLIEISLALIRQSPFFGVPGYLSFMEELRQGQGIIDIVNTYIAVALNTGLVGLTLFVGIFASAIWPLLRIRIARGAAVAESGVAVSLVATILAAMTVLATTSAIVVILPVTYMLIGLGVSWARLHPAPAPNSRLGGWA